MTLHMFRCAPGALDGASAGTELSLDGAEGRHAGRVMRLGVGDALLVADGHGLGAQAVITSVVEEGLRLRVDRAWSDAAPSPSLVLVQALAKGGRDEDAIEAATELGVDGVIPWQAQRCIVQWKGPKADKGQHKWAQVVAGAAKQSRRTRDPQVAAVVSTDQLAQRIAAADLAIVLHEDASTPLTDLPLPSEGEILLIVGPEGGIPDHERDALLAAGAQLAQLGPHVLRASTAGPAALAVLSARLRWGVAGSPTR